MVNSTYALNITFIQGTVSAGRGQFQPHGQKYQAVKMLKIISNQFRFVNIKITVTARLHATTLANDFRSS